MTVVGLLLILAGAVAAMLTNSVYNGLWLIGLALAVVGLLMAWHDRKDGPRE